MSELSPGDLLRVVCNACEFGRVALGEHLVTREMALDAGDASLEGSFLEIEYGNCPECAGDGWVYK